VQQDVLLNLWHKVTTLEQDLRRVKNAKVPFEPTALIDVDIEPTDTSSRSTNAYCGTSSFQKSSVDDLAGLNEDDLIYLDNTTDLGQWQHPERAVEMQCYRAVIVVKKITEASSTNGALPRLSLLTTLK